MLFSSKNPLVLNTWFVNMLSKYRQAYYLMVYQIYYQILKSFKSPMHIGFKVTFYGGCKFGKVIDAWKNRILESILLSKSILIKY